MAFSSRGRSAESGRDSFYLTTRTKKVLFALIAAGILIGAGALLAQNLGRITPVDAGAVAVRISMAGWDPATLTTRTGASLKVDVIAMDDAHGAGHDFRIDELGVNEYVGSTQKVFTLSADAAGSYTFYCSLCCGGKDSPTMLGTLRVNP